MRRRGWALVAVVLAGALAGAGFGYFVLRPSDHDLEVMAQQLVPAGFEITDVDTYFSLPIWGTGLSSVSAANPGHYQRGDTAQVAELARQHGWDVIGTEYLAEAETVSVARPGALGFITMRTELETSPDLSVGLYHADEVPLVLPPAVVGGALAGAAFWLVSRSRRRAGPTTASGTTGSAMVWHPQGPPQDASGRST